MFWISVAFLLISNSLAQNTIPDDVNYVDDLGFLDVAVDRGENAILCEQLFSMALLVDIALVAVFLITYGLIGRHKLARII
jgi:hypothetical protein